MVAGVLLAERVGPFDGCVDDVVIARYAAALGVEQRPLLPTVLVTQIWEAQNVARSAGRNCLVTLRYATVDSRDAVVAEQWWTTVYLGTGCDPTGEATQAHTFPDDARDRPIGTWTRLVDGDMPRRYAEASGDWSDHHFDLDAARRSGADSIFLHGLCTLGLCAQAVTELAPGGDPGRLGRIAVRFAAPTPVGESLHVRLYEAGEGAVAFEADCAGTAVITHGRAELRDRREERRRSSSAGRQSEARGAGGPNQ